MEGTCSSFRGQSQSSLNCIAMTGDGQAVLTKATLVPLVAMGGGDLLYGSKRCNNTESLVMQYDSVWWRDVLQSGRVRE